MLNIQIFSIQAEVYFICLHLFGDFASPKQVELSVLPAGSQTQDANIPSVASPS